MINSEKFFRMLGLALRAGGVFIGEGAARDSIRKKTAHLLILAKDSSENTKKRFKNSCEFYSVPCIEYGDKASLGKALGREFSAVISVSNKDIAKNLMDILNET